MKKWCFKKSAVNLNCYHSFNKNLFVKFISFFLLWPPQLPTSSLALQFFVHLNKLKISCFFLNFPLFFNDFKDAGTGCRISKIFYNYRQDVIITFSFYPRKNVFHHYCYILLRLVVIDFRWNSISEGLDFLNKTLSKKIRLSAA